MKLFIATCVGIIVFFLVFVFMVFVNWSVDMASWLPSQRFFTALMAFIFGGLSSFIVWERQQ